MPWDGAPETEPDLMIRVWDMDGYYYVHSKSPHAIVVSNDAVLTRQQIIDCVVDQIHAHIQKAEEAE